MPIRNYKDLIVWQKAMDLSVEIYRLVKNLPKEELYCLSDQMRRSAISIPSNIAEGKSRTSQKEFSYFLSIAQGSRSELETQIQLCEKIGYLNADEIKNALDLLTELEKMLVKLQATVK